MTARKVQRKPLIDTPAQIAGLSALYGMPSVRNDQQPIPIPGDDDSSQEQALPWDDEADA